VLPLVTNVLPQSSAPQANVLAGAQASFQSGQASTTTRQITASAINAAPAASAFYPQPPERRSAAVTARVATPAPQTPSQTPQTDPASFLPDPKLWKVPNREVSQPLVPTPVRAPVQEATAQLVQQNIQASLQENQLARQEQTQNNALAARRMNTLAAKKPGISDSSGAGAYAVANQRNLAMSLPSTIETVI